MTKPPYRIPLMDEIRAVEPNGLTAASFFAGCGGSSLGYRMAGYRMGYANEFVPAAADTYAANASPSTVIDRRDIRQITAEEVLDALGMEQGQLDVLDGSPPCASFSMAGKREALWGQVKKYSDTEQRTDDLFTEYLRMVAGVRPKVAVAENVPGMLIGTAVGVFHEILEAFEEIGYHARAAVLEAHWLGVPQARRRLFFVATRADLGVAPVFPRPLPYWYGIRDALPHVRNVVIHNETSGFQKQDSVFDSQEPIPTIQAGGIAGRNHSQYHVEAETDISGYAIGEQWDRIGGFGQSDKFFQLVRPDPERPSPTITATTGQTGAASVVHPTEKRKFSVAELKRLCGFPDDFVLTGTYTQQVERLGRAVCPPVSMAVGRTIADRILRRGS